MVNGIKKKCDFCNEQAVYDTKTTLGPWAFTCNQHFEVYSTKQPGFYKPIVRHPDKATKVCVLCGQHKELSEYYKYKDKNGVERFRNDCKECHLAERKRVSFKKERGAGK